MRRSGFSGNVLLQRQNSLQGTGNLATNVGVGSDSLAEAIVLLGCRILPGGHLSRAAERRVAMAASAYFSGVSSRVIVSGGRLWGAHAEAVVLARSLVDRGVPEERLILELWSLSTYENAVFSAAILEHLGARRVGLVTCSSHMPRAMENFAAVGLDPVPIDAGDEARKGHLFSSVRERLSTYFDRRARRRASVYRDAAARVLSVWGRDGTEIRPSGTKK